MSRGDGQPVTCQLCGEHYADNDALWDHECPAWLAEVRRAQPRLEVYRNIERWYETVKTKHPLRERIVAWALRTRFPDKADPDLLDALEKMGPRFSRRLEAKLVRTGQVVSRERSGYDKLRRQIEVEARNEEAEIARITADSKKRRRNK